MVNVVATEQGLKATLNERRTNYGDIVDNSEITEALCDVIRNHPNYSKMSKTHHLCLYMILHKISRLVCGDPLYSDNMHDVCGYAKLLEDYIINQNKEKENG